MLFEALRNALSGMIRMPVLWLAGLFLGFFVMGDLMLEYYSGFFLAGKLWIIGIIILPLFIAGMLHSIKSGDPGFGPFFREGMKRYFRVLLPGLIILFVALVTIGLIILGLTLIGIGPGSGVTIIPIAGVIIPFIFFTIFYDTVAVFEDKPAFESIRRSVEIVLSRPGPVLVFFISILIVVFGVTFLLLIIWRLPSLHAARAAYDLEHNPDRSTDPRCIHRSPRDRWDMDHRNPGRSGAYPAGHLLLCIQSIRIPGNSSRYGRSGTGSRRI